MKRFRDHADATAQQIFAKLGVSPTPTQRAAIVAIIEQQLVGNAVATREWCADHARQSTASGRRIAEEIHTAHEALLANLSSLR